MSNKRTFDLEDLGDQTGAYLPADRSDLSEAKRIEISKLITQAVLTLYDPSTSGINATNLQDAIDEIIAFMQKEMWIWRGYWSDTAQYYKNNVINIDRWLMIAKVDQPTIGLNPLPEISGNTFYAVDLGDSPAWETVETTSWFSTGYIGTSEIPKVIKGGKVWLTTDNTVRQVLTLSKVNSLGEDVTIGSRVWEAGSVSVEGWENVLLKQPITVYPHDTYKVELFSESLGGEDSLHQDTWYYNGVNNNPDHVYYGSATQNSAANVLHIYEYSNTNTLLDFSDMVAGDIVTQEVGESEWAFQISEPPAKNTTNTGVWDFTGVYLYKIGEIDSGSNVLYDFIRPGNGPLSYKKISNGVAGIDQITGILGQTQTQDAYGVDFILDTIDISDEWDILSYFEVVNL